MSDPDATARNRYYAIVGVHLVATAGAVFGLVILGRASDLAPKLIGAGIIIAALYVMAVVPRALARRWRSPPDE